MSMLFRRKLSVILMIALVLSIFTGCGQSKTSKSANANSSQNIAQMGFVVQKDDWVYYTDLLEVKLYKVKKDGTGKEVLVKTAEMTSSDEGNFTPDDSAPVENPENQPIKLEALAELNNAVVGELNKAYAYSSSDGSGSIGFASIETFTDDYNDGKNTYSNAVVIKLVGEEVYYHVLEFYFFDQNGKLFRESMTTIGKSDHSMLFSGDDANLADFVAYIMILGLDASQNDGKRKVIFEVSSGTN